jgi:hypothetical protein
MIGGVRSTHRATILAAALVSAFVLAWVSSASLGGCAFELAPVAGRPTDASERPDAPESPADARVGPDTAPALDGGTNDAGDASSALVCDAANLLSCFRFEGAVVDEAPSPAVPTSVASVAFVAGIAGQAIAVGSASVVTFPADTRWDTTAHTIEAWVRLETLPDAGRAGIFDSDGRYGLFIAADGTPFCARSTAQAPAPLVAGEWTHVACASDSLTVTLYVNGAAVASSVLNPPAGTPGTTAIGSNAPSGDPFVGAIDTLRIFKVARTAPEIAAAARR